MDNFVLLVLLFLALPAWLLYRRWSLRRRKLPPGPFPPPIIGNILQLGQHPNRSLAKLARTYGPLMSLRLGSSYAVIVSSSEMAKEVLQKHDAVFSGRAMPTCVKVHDHHNVSMNVIPLGSRWRKFRKICAEKLFSNIRLDGSEELRTERLTKLREYVRECSEGGREMNVVEATFVTMMNLMWATLFSSEMTTYDSDASQELKEIINGITRYMGLPNVADFFPIFERLDPQGIKRKVEFYMGKLLAIMGDLVEQRLKSRRSTLHYQKKNDFLETLLDIHEGGEYDLSLKEIKHLLTDLIIAGADTTSSTTEWAMTELLLNPDKLSKAKHELRTIIGENKQMRESDISRLPYLKAVVKEVLRCHPPSPLLAPHKTEEDVELNGYIIPKHTKVLINVWAITKDPTLWTDPNSFEPERFLDNNIDFKGQDFELIPFGSGRRICPGLPLAYRMLHVLVATLIHNFDWKFEVGAEGKEAHRTDVFGLALQKAFPLRATPISL
uniref:Cytochrome P450 CYP76AH10 n=1 Tax=Plectranthus barbatus TaxID=41228 RepID=A0A1B0VRN9_9LAMI|nr:cytochrome P450 CYP76AH10 [Plectranthus barbatus]